MLLLWPAVAALGFVALMGVVIALAADSTARYEFDRNSVPAQRQLATASAGAPGHDAGGRPARPPAEEQHRPPSWGGEPTVVRSSERTTPAARSLRRHPAGSRAGRGAGNRDGETAPLTGWWLVDPEVQVNGAPRMVAGPFADPLDAEWAALGSGLPGAEGARAVYGVRRPGGALVRRPSPKELAWYAEVGAQLDRLGDDWDCLLTDTDPLTTLVVDVTAALLDAGLPLDRAGHSRNGDPVGGVCLTPDPGRGGILVAWRQHDRMSLDRVRGDTAAAAVQQTMNVAVGAVLTQLGFRVEPVGNSGAHLVLVEP